MAHARLTGSLMLGALQNHLNAVAFLCHVLVSLYQLANMPLARASFNTAVMPLLLIVLIAFVETFKVIHLPSSGM